jgi:hypothetical protein
VVDHGRKSYTRQEDEIILSLWSLHSSDWKIQRRLMAAGFVRSRTSIRGRRHALKKMGRTALTQANTHASGPPM